MVGKQSSPLALLFGIGFLMACGVPQDHPTPPPVADAKADVACQYSCATYHYHANECYEGFRCDANGTCLTYVGTPDAPDACPSACVPTSCASQGAACGVVADGCGGTLKCGDCGPGSECNQGQCRPLLNECACDPATQDCDHPDGDNDTDDTCRYLSCAVAPDGTPCGGTANHVCRAGSCVDAGLVTRFGIPANLLGAAIQMPASCLLVDKYPGGYNSTPSTGTIVLKFDAANGALSAQVSSLSISGVVSTDDPLPFVTTKFSGANGAGQWLDGLDWGRSPDAAHHDQVDELSATIKCGDPSCASARVSVSLTIDTFASEGLRLELCITTLDFDSHGNAVPVTPLPVPVNPFS